MKRLLLLFLLLVYGIKGQSPVNSVGSGCALQFDGVNDYVATPSLSGLYGNRNTFTMECWYSPIQLSGSILSLGRTHLQSFVLDVLHSDGLDWYAYGSSGNPSCPNCWHISPTTPFVIGKWYHLCGVFEDIGGGNMRVIFYVNGIKQGEKISGYHNLLGNSVSNISYLLMGENSWPNTYSNSFIDEVRIWNYARTQAEIQRDMCRKLTGTEPGLVGYWRFDECGGNTVFDASGNGNNGTLY